MRKNRLISLLSTIAVIAIVQVFLSVSASAAIIDGTTTSMRFDVLGGGSSYAPYELSVNPSGEYCTRDAGGLTFQVNNIAGYYAIKSVDFKVTAQKSGYSTTYTKTVSGSLANTSAGTQFRFSSLTLCDNYTVEAYAADNYGNTYYWSKKVKRDRNIPAVSNLGIISKGSSINAADGNVIVNNDVTLSFGANDVNTLTSSWIKEVSLQVYDSTQAQPIKDVILTPNSPSTKNFGSCLADISLLNFGNTQKTLTAYITVKDYANNETTETKTFYYDRKYTSGTLSKGNQTATSVDCYFDAESDISGVYYCKFILTTSQNGTTVRSEVFGTKASANRWKLTLDKTTLNSTSGLFRIEVFTLDNIGNYGFTGTMFHQF